MHGFQQLPEGAGGPVNKRNSGRTGPRINSYSSALRPVVPSDLLQWAGERRRGVQTRRSPVTGNASSAIACMVHLLRSAQCHDVSLVQDSYKRIHRGRDAAIVVRLIGREWHHVALHRTERGHGEHLERPGRPLPLTPPASRDRVMTSIWMGAPRTSACMGAWGPTGIWMGMGIRRMGGRVYRRMCPKGWIPRSSMPTT